MKVLKFNFGVLLNMEMESLRSRWDFIETLMRILLLIMLRCGYGCQSVVSRTLNNLPVLKIVILMSGLCHKMT
jgi:hypothetical protein